jgi:hypothetical protein
MPTALIVALIVIAVIAGLIFTLRTSARTGMPSKDVLERATQRSREMQAREQTENPDRND